MNIIGLTGGSGAGKSTVAQLLRQKGAGWVDADAVYHALCRENQDMLAELCAAFGDVLDERGSLDRGRLAPLVFSDANRLALLNHITVPYIRAAACEAFAAFSDCPFVLFDAPTLFQSGTDSLCSGGVIGVIAPRALRISRIMARDEIPFERAAARIDAQPDEPFYRSRCRWIIENDSTREAVERQCSRLFGEITTGLRKLQSTF